MSPDELKNSAAYQAVENALKLVTRNLDSADSSILSYLEMTIYLISTIPESVPDYIVNTSLEPIKKLVTTYLGASNQNLTQAINQLQQILDIKNDDQKLIEFLSQQPPLLVQKYQIQKQNKQEIANHILDSEIIPQLKQQLKNQLNHSLQQYNNGVKPLLTDFAFIFSAPRVRNIESDLEQIEQLKKSTEETLRKIEVKWQESKNLVTYIAKGTIDGHYALQTKKEEIRSNWWMAFSILLIILAIVWLCCVIYNGITLCSNITMDKYKFLLYFVPRGSMTLCILGLATYFGKQASYHRQNADFLRTRAFSLQSISPFLDDIGKEKPEILIASKQKIVETLLKDFDKK